LLHYLG